MWHVYDIDVRQRLHESDHQVDGSVTETSAASRSQGQDRLGNAAMLDRVGLDKTPGDGEGDPAGDAETGPAEVSHGGSSPTAPPGGESIAPLPSGEELIAPIQPPAEEIAVVRPEIAPACDYTQWVPGSCSPDMGSMGVGDVGGMGMDMGDMGGQFEMPQVGMGAQQVATMSEEEFATYEQQTNDLVNTTIVNMSTEEKRSTLAEFGYSGETIKTMDETMMNQALAGTLCKTIRAYRIQGMTPEELDRLPAKEQRQFLTDLGVPAKDLWKAKDRHIRQAVKDVVAVAKTPGHHKVKLKIRGGWFRGKSYDINMQVDDEGHLADVDIEKKGGLFSKIGGLIKMAMPYIAKLLAGVTGGLSLLAYGIYQAIEAARSGDWLQGIKIAAGAFVGAGFDTIGDIIGRVGDIAGAAVKGFQAIKSRNLGGIIDAFATGAEGVAGFAKNELGEFAKTCRKWADTARTWGGYVVLGVGVFQAIRGKDPLAAIAGSLDLVVSLRDHGQRDEMGPPTSLSNNPGVLVTSARLFGYARDARDAATGDPPRWGAFAANMFDMAGEYTDSGKIDTGRNIALYTQDFDTAYRAENWSAAGQAILNISETIDLAHRGDISEEEQEQVSGRYDTAGTIITPGLQTVENIQTGNWAAALASGLITAKNAELSRAEPEDVERINNKYKTLDRYLEPSVGCANALSSGDWSQVAMFAAQLGGELSSNGRFDKGAFFTQQAGLMITKIEAGDWTGALAIGEDLWGELEKLWGDTPSGKVEDAGVTEPDGGEGSKLGPAVFVGPPAPSGGFVGPPAPSGGVVGPPAPSGGQGQGTQDPTSLTGSVSTDESYDAYDARSFFQYRVQSGDTLGKIAARYGVAGGSATLARYNGIDNPNLISPGQVVYIPGVSAQDYDPADVKEAQEILNSWSKFTSPYINAPDGNLIEDGNWDSETEQALVAYKTRYKDDDTGYGPFNVINGKLTPLTLEKLKHFKLYKGEAFPLWDAEMNRAKRVVADCRGFVEKFDQWELGPTLASIVANDLPSRTDELERWANNDTREQSNYDQVKERADDLDGFLGKIKARIEVVRQNNKNAANGFFVVVTAISVAPVLLASIGMSISMGVTGTLALKAIQSIGAFAQARNENDFKNAVVDSIFTFLPGKVPISRDSVAGKVPAAADWLWAAVRENAKDLSNGFVDIEADGIEDWMNQAKGLLPGFGLNTAGDVLLAQINSKLPHLELESNPEFAEKLSKEIKKHVIEHFDQAVVEEIVDTIVKRNP